MMRRLYLLSTAMFWMAVLAFWSASLWLPDELPSPGTVAVAADKAITRAELARHAKPGDCWMAIDGVVYDFTAYLPQHPAEPSLMTAWCGKEATDAYRTKTKGRPHSPYADQLLPKYRIGPLTDTR
jgi:cytochrome b involved in lipid metabolism